MSELTLAVALGIVAAAYAAVGQAGGTGYVAVLSLADFAPDVIKSSGLVLNILVSAIGCFYAYRARLLSWRSCYPFAILGAPFSVIGGALHLPPLFYMPLLGTLLFIAAALMFRSAYRADIRDAAAPISPPFVSALLSGGAIGFLSGVTGVGGGIYLAPLLLLFTWSTTRNAAAITAVYNLMNSAAALTGVVLTAPSFPDQIPIWCIAVSVGGIAGALFGLNIASPRTLRFILAALLLVAAMRMIAVSLGI